MDAVSQSRSVSPLVLLPTDRRIIEKRFMEYRPFGKTPKGEPIRDVSGVTVKANVDYLEEVVSRAKGVEAGTEAIGELTRLLNERLRDPAYHVNPEFLKNTWNSYSYEFVSFLGEFCLQLSGDPLFAFHCGQEKFIPPIIQTLGKPFSVEQIYKMFPYFGEKYAKGSLKYEVVTVGRQTATLRMCLTDHVQQQFGEYLPACAKLICHSAKAALSSIPLHVHGLKPATIKDRTCIAEGDDYCEWEFTWHGDVKRQVPGALLGAAASVLLYVHLRVGYPEIRLIDAVVISLLLGAGFWLASLWRRLYSRAQSSYKLVQEQVTHLEERHEELRETCLQQEQSAVELKRKVSQLTTLHHTGLIFSSTLDRDILIEKALDAIIQDLHYDRAMLALYDAERRVSHDARVHGVSDQIASFVRSMVVPITDPTSMEGKVLLQGIPVLIDNVQNMLNDIHPLNQQLVKGVNAKSIISVPLHVGDRITGSLTVDRIQESALSQDDLDLMVTVARQVAIALDKAEAYRQVEELNLGLEAKVRDRTAELQRLHRELEVTYEQLKNLDQQKDVFLGHLSHELRTPLTCIKWFVENMLDGIASTPEKQKLYLTRMNMSVDRLVRMINELLDLTRIAAGKLVLTRGEVNLESLASEVIDELRPLALEKHQELELKHPSTDARIMADGDKMHQILTNLLDNAIKYTPAGGNVMVSLAKDNGNVTIAVSDTGEGIPQDMLQHLFDPFFRGGARSGAKGLGLGLWITKKMVELHNGTISVTSEIGKGSEFQVHLPLATTK